MKERVFIEEAGCNRRQLDIKNIRTYLEANGYEIAEHPEDADKILVATCAFKKLEEDESVQRLRHFRKYGREIVVYGCLPDIAEDRYREFADIPKVAPREIEKIEDYFPGQIKKYADITDTNLVDKKGSHIFKSIVRTIQTKPTMDLEFWHRMLASGRKKIADIVSPPATPYYLFACRGCLGLCSYCAIRKSVGSVRSKPIPMVVNEFQKGVKDGYRDFTILGDDPGCYGVDLGSSLPDLLQALFSAASDIEREELGSKKDLGSITFRLNEIHPKFLIPYSEKFLEMERFASINSILCPIQSGNSRVLDLMQREHTAEEFEEVVKKIRRHQPQTIFNTQIIVGFPSETEDEFQETLERVARCQFNSVVVFPYDDKFGSDSSLLPEKVPAQTIQRRMRQAFQYFAKTGVTAYYKCP